MIITFICPLFRWIFKGFCTFFLIISGLGCGWCYDKSNPTIGQCLSGSFNMSSTLTCPNEWAYDKCPDIDECHLGLHDCHMDADCLNTDGSFECKCKKVDELLFFGSYFPMIFILELKMLK